MPAQPRVSRAPRPPRAAPPAVTEPDPRTIAGPLVAWYQGVQRDLPWRRVRDAYAIWVSEIMLQQTRVATVIPYWERWMARFPTVAALAAAPLDDVLAAWAGLGYYSRARNLHRGAREVAARWDGQLPGDALGLRAVPGIGAYTAGAIASIAFGERTPLVDGNVARVLARVFALEDDVKSTRGLQRLWALATEVMSGLPDDAAPGDLNQGLMELGATACAPRGPTCLVCPLAGACRARALGRQAELPVMPARKRAAELPLLARVALWIERDQQILLARRAPSGLFGGLWELPQAATALDAAAAVGVSLAAIGDEVAAHAQTLSHRRLQIQVVAARVTPASVGASLGNPPDPGYDAVAWHELDARTFDLGVSSATATIFQLRLRDKEPPRWHSSSIPRPPPSSPRATRRSSKDSASSATTSPTTTSSRPRPARRAASTSSSTTRRR